MSFGASAVFFIDSTGNVLISRNYKGDVPISCVERFTRKLIETPDLEPVMRDGEITYIYIKFNDIYLLVTSNKNANATMILMFLYQAVKVCTQARKIIKLI